MVCDLVIRYIHQCVMGKILRVNNGIPPDMLRWVRGSTVAVGGVGALFTRNSASGGWPLTFDIDILFTLLILDIDDVNACKQQ